MIGICSLLWFAGYALDNIKIIRTTYTHSYRSLGCSSSNFKRLSFYCCAEKLLITFFFWCIKMFLKKFHYNFTMFACE